MAKPFYTDGMTVDEILALGDDVLRRLDQRDLSRALRTVSLAANKRVNRLLENAVKTKEGYRVKKSGAHNVALDALNSLTEDGRLKPQFSVGDKNRNQMYAEFARARAFMSKKTSTIKGAESVRKAREVRIMGETVEEAQKRKLKQYEREYRARTGKKVTKKQRERLKTQIRNEFASMSAQAWSTFRKFLENEGISNSPYQHFFGSTEVQTLIGQRTAAGDSEGDIINAARHMYDQKYEQEMTDLIDEINDLDGLEMEF